jgi:hypothetical protein
MFFAADARFGYFLARQFIRVLPAIAILAGNSGRRNHFAHTLPGLPVTVSVWQSIRLLTRPCENWQAAADMISSIRLATALKGFWL